MYQDKPGLYKIMEEMGMYPDGDFSLEVSSPGLDEPLKLHRQYKKNIGREVEVIMNDDAKKRRKTDCSNMKKPLQLNIQKEREKKQL